jgi:uncharacterized repeat protein (TIGR03803 family)
MKILILPRPIVCPCSGRAGYDKHLGTLHHLGPCPKPAPWRDLVLLALMLGLGLAWVQPAGAQQLAFQRLKSFGIPSQAGAEPFANVIQGSDGALYGTTAYGSPNAIEGTVFKMNTNGSGFTVLHGFTNYPGDGAGPGGALVQGRDGALYGTTGSGGTYDAGTVFKLNTDGSGYQVIYNFGQGNTAGPLAALVQGSDGTLYGTTYGGNGYKGTVFKLSTNGSSYMVLHTFTGTSGDGEKPYAPLVIGSDGALYGTTEDGGSGGGGTVFKLQTSGSGYMVLHPFTGDNGDGESPVAALIQGRDGALYGTTEDGGSNSLGAIFTLNTNGSGYTTLYSFTYVDEGPPNGVVYPYGLYPEAALVQGRDGELYGTTAGNSGNNENGAGTVFKLNTDGSDFTTVYSFTIPGNIDSFGTNVDGETPVAPLIQGTDGAFYGTAELGGNAFGTVYKVNGDGSGFTALHAFSNTGGDGITPMSALFQGSDGTLYGSTIGGGNAGTTGAGTVFKLKPDGSGYTIVLNLPCGPFAYDTDANSVNVILGNDGVLYGTTEFNGGIYEDVYYDGGEVFKVNTDGSGFMVLHTFETPYGDGAQPVAALVQGSDGALYGTTEQGTGEYVYGTVFKLNTDGSGYQVLYTFSPASDGGLPSAALIQGSDGMLYGTTMDYGTNGYGTAFKLDTNGNNFAVIHSFGLGNDGQQPQAALVQGKDGFLYGTTYYGGTNQQGMVFKLSTNGSVYADLYDFSAYAPDTSGAGPAAALVQGSDGALYGTTSGSGGGGFGAGTVFKLNTDGSGFTVLYTFLFSPFASGEGPEAALLQGKNGSFYGTTHTGGDLGFGTIFALVASPLPTLYISQSGNTVTVFWQDVSGWTLQQNNNLTMPAGWSASSGVTTSNGTNYLNITPPTGDLFFRLIYP